MNALLDRSLDNVFQGIELPGEEELSAMLALEVSGDVPQTAADYLSKAKEHFFTPATDATLGRPVLGALIARRLAKGEGRVLPLFLVMAATDAEGQIARGIDRIAPGSGWGATEKGKSLDPIADSIGFLEVAAGALKGPKVSRLGKLAVGIVLAQEGIKSVWAVRAGRRHHKETGGQLVLSPSRTGKQATAEKFAALALAVSTHDMESGHKRAMAGFAAVGAAVLGAYHGEEARRSYKLLLAK